MDLGTMVRELGTGMLITTEIFVLTLVFSLPLEWCWPLGGWQG